MHICADTDLKLARGYSFQPIDGSEAQARRTVGWGVAPLLRGGDKPRVNTLKAQLSREEEEAGGQEGETRDEVLERMGW